MTGRTPSRGEAMARCRELFDEYADIKEALSIPDEAEKILGFVQKFGEVRQTPQGAWELVEPSLPAPRPDPELNMTNAFATH